MKSPTEVADEILRQFDRLGHLEYGERVNMREHMLQAAVFAERDGADNTMVVAALLHDIGHFIHGLDEDIAERGIDGLHELAGAEYLAKYFPAEVSEPARLHVAAKRYLCATDAAYYASVSPASLQSLELQGGAFSAEEASEFEQHPHFEVAVQVRRYDDAGKVPGMATPSVEAYRSRIEQAVRRGGAR